MFRPDWSAHHELLWWTKSPPLPRNKGIRVLSGLASASGDIAGAPGRAGGLVVFLHSRQPRRLVPMAVCILSQLFLTPVGSTKSVTRGTDRCDLRHIGAVARSCAECHEGMEVRANLLERQVRCCQDDRDGHVSIVAVEVRPKNRLFHLKRSDVSDDVVDVLLSRRVANRVDCLKTGPPDWHVF
jgi:hypothetical protein